MTVFGLFGVFCLIICLYNIVIVFGLFWVFFLIICLYNIKSVFGLFWTVLSDYLSLPYYECFLDCFGCFVWIFVFIILCFWTGLFWVFFSYYLFLQYYGFEHTLYFLLCIRVVRDLFKLFGYLIFLLVQSSIAVNKIMGVAVSLSKLWLQTH